MADGRTAKPSGARREGAAMAFSRSASHWPVLQSANERDRAFSLRPGHDDLVRRRLPSGTRRASPLGSGLWRGDPESSGRRSPQARRCCFPACADHERSWRRQPQARGNPTALSKRGRDGTRSWWLTAQRCSTRPCTPTRFQALWLEHNARQTMTPAAASGHNA
ncbi:hypothetical protein D1007_54249 [Hordeum vulgare]|nr:hypothetical protein D1007_54249 [Hordeum vulgare]